MRFGPPIVDDLYTRQLERGAVVRASVEHATVVAATPAGVELATTATARRRIGPSAAGFPLADGTSLTGRLRIDVLADDVLRVRYAEGDAVRDNPTPMVVGALRPPRDLRVATGEESVRLVTASLVVDVALDPLALDVRIPGGRSVCSVGGRDKNHLAMTNFVWDAFSTGICRALPDGRPLAVESFASRVIAGADETDVTAVARSASFQASSPSSTRPSRAATRAEQDDPHVAAGARERPQEVRSQQHHAAEEPEDA